MREVEFWVNLWVIYWVNYWMHYIAKVDLLRRLLQVSGGILLMEVEFWVN